MADGNPTTYVVIWRGAGLRQAWHRSVMMDATHADQVQRDLIRMGYRAYIIDEDDAVRCINPVRS